MIDYSDEQRGLVPPFEAELLCDECGCAIGDGFFDHGEGAVLCDACEAAADADTVLLPEDDHATGN
jgi:hypothetical protein